MKSHLWIALLIVGLGASIALQRWIDAQRGVGSAVEEALYVTSGKTLKRASLGFDGLLADLYWLRTIQYFGGKSQQIKGDLNIGNVTEWKLTLLEPLINITTELDPHYVSAYRFGSLFLPDINPDSAIKLAERASADNPNDWRLQQDLGFIFWKLKRFDEASAAYLQGSRLPEAPKWMEQMAAIMRANGGDRETAKQMFFRIYETTDDPTVKKTSLGRLQSYQAEDEVAFLNRLLTSYREQKGSCPTSLPVLIRALPPNALQQIKQVGMNFDEGFAPLDPHGFAYRFEAAACTVALANDSTIVRWRR
jgi:tetratricopeptide (TPR) repeat protein